MKHMQWRRRRLINAGLGMAVTGAAGLSRIARAATFPSRTIEFMVPFGPGGTFDGFVREFSTLMTGILDVSVVAVNQPGGGGTEAIFEIFGDKPDGYTISMIDMPGVLLHQKQLRMPLETLTWLGNLGRDGYGLAVSTHSMFRSVDDLHARAKQRPISFAVTGLDSSYVATKIFAASLGLNATFVTGYKSSASSSVAVARGDVDAVVYSLATLRKMEKAGLLKLIFVFEAHSPIPGIQDATAVGQPDLGQIFQWRPVVAPPGLASARATKLTATLLEAANSQKAKDWAARLGTDLYPLGQADTLKMLKTQQALVQKYHKAILAE